MPGGWWMRKRHYFLYVVREFTALPLAIWLLWLLVEIKRAGDGPAGGDGKVERDTAARPVAHVEARVVMLTNRRIQGVFLRAPENEPGDDVDHAHGCVRP